MIKLNKKMQIQLHNMKQAIEPLPEELRQLISQGFVIREGYVFLSALLGRNTNVDDNSFPDKVGYECFINSIHIDDYVESNYLEHACCFIDQCFGAWRHAKQPGLIKAILSCDEFGAVVKFHADRSDESWIAQEIEEYDEAILVADSGSSISSWISQRR